MRLNRTHCVLLFFLLASCAAPRPAARRGAAPSPAQAPRQQPLTRKQKQLLDQLYYQAVSAYSADEIKSAESYLSEIFKLDPSYAPALELRKKIRLAGEKR